MLCPEVWNFPHPKVMCTKKENETVEAISRSINMNNFYKSVIITCPDEMQTPSIIEEIVTEDNDYYKISKCPLTEFLDPVFIQSFVKNGRLFCLSVDRNCVTQNCFCITPDGILTLHVLEFIYQTLGLEGTKRPLNYYEIRIDLKTLKKPDKVHSALNKLEFFDFYVIWEPIEENVCPSSIAKYFNDKNYEVALKLLDVKEITPAINEVPCLKDVEIEDLVEWIGVLTHEGNINPKEIYISSYNQPESENALKTNRISLLIAKGFFSPTTIVNICHKIAEYVTSRCLVNYWASLSVQSWEHSLWQWMFSSSRMFQAHDSTYNVFFTQEGHRVYSIGQLKYS